ncbi:hypothetical protein ABZU86_20655 [Streptomyces sp. NPDC005271]|uniref:hypothetical protein n=1 Tax=unclassified Streptomyces TaxID=2593676 RepID=UPI0033A7E6BF
MLHTLEAFSAADRRETDPYRIGYFTDAELAGATGGRLLEMARSQPHAYTDQVAEPIREALEQCGLEACCGHVLD